MQRYMMKESEQGNICDGLRLKNYKGGGSLFTTYKDLSYVKKNVKR